MEFYSSSQGTFDNIYLPLVFKDFLWNDSGRCLKLSEYSKKSISDEETMAADSKPWLFIGSVSNWVFCRDALAASLGRVGLWWDDELGIERLFLDELNVERLDEDDGLTRRYSLSTVLVNGWVRPIDFTLGDVRKPSEDCEINPELWSGSMQNGSLSL